MRTVFSSCMAQESPLMTSEISNLKMPMRTKNQINMASVAWIPTLTRLEHWLTKLKNDWRPVIERETGQGHSSCWAVTIAWPPVRSSVSCASSRTPVSFGWTRIRTSTHRLHPHRAPFTACRYRFLCKNCKPKCRICRNWNSLSRCESYCPYVFSKSKIGVI